MSDHWAHVRTYLLGQVLFACTALAGLMAWHIVDGDRFGFLLAAMGAGLGYADAMANAYGRSLPPLYLGGMACGVGSAGMLFF